MDIMGFTLIVGMLVAIVCAGANIAYVLTDQRRRAKKPVRLVAGLGSIYLTVIYAWAYLDSSSLIIRTGFLTRLGVITLLVLYLAEVIADWQLNKRE